MINQYFKRNMHRGSAMMIFMILFLIMSSVLVIGVSRSVYQDVLRQRILVEGKESFFASEGGIEDALYRHRNSLEYSSLETFVIGTTSVFVSRTGVFDGYEFLSEAITSDNYRTGFLKLVFGEGASFNFGLQSDTGGIIMENSSSVLGNIYSNGTVVGTGGGAGNLVTGSIISAGPSGYVEGVHATGSVWAHSIDDSIIDEDAYCDDIDDSTVGGLLYCNTVTATSPNPADFPGPADQATSSLPISDADIDAWKAIAEAGGVISSTSPECTAGPTLGTYTINTDTTLGPVKIECNLFIDKSSTDLTLQGSIWVEGNVTTKSGPTILIDPSEPALAGKSLYIIADNPANRTTSSQIILQNSATFTGSSGNSYILLISQNNDEEIGGPEVAISSSQSAAGDVVMFAGHGEILISQSGSFVGLSGLLLRLRNSAQVIYKTGAVSLNFPSGPGGGYVVSDWDAEE